MNVADSELIEGMLHQEGYTPIREMSKADAIFVNTCAIREHAEAKVHSRLGLFNKVKRDNPSVIIGVLGCMAQNLKDELLINKPYVDIILGPDGYRRLPDYLRRNEKKIILWIQNYPVLKYMMIYSPVESKELMRGYPLCVVVINFAHFV